MMEVNELESVKQSEIFEDISTMGHEQVVFCNDNETGLKSIIGIHNTILGPAVGGVRMWPYENEQEAVNDVLRLSRGMTLKSAITGINLGGGKAVIIGEPSKLKNEALLRRFGKFIDGLGGRYVTAEDVNMSTRDMQYIHMETDYVTGLPLNLGGGGDPSPITAYGTYVGMKAAAKVAYGSDSLEGKTVAVQGVGQVGKYLVDHLVRENANIYISDISEEKLSYVTGKHKVRVVSTNDIYDLEMNIFAPCALGGSINDDTIDSLKCDIVAGGANNQLRDEERHGKELLDRGITYAPDFVINAGGIINVYLEYLGEYEREHAYKMAENIYATCEKILKYGMEKKIPPQKAAIQMALKRIKEIGNIKLSY